MVHTFFHNLNTEKGITLVEIVVVIFLIGILSSILISNFPMIQQNFALSRSAYTLAEDLRRAEDMGLSGVTVNDLSGAEIPARGYGLYVATSTATPSTQYLIYADVGYYGIGDQKYDPTDPNSNYLCSQNSDIVSDCIIDQINLASQNSNLYIVRIQGIANPTSGSVSINFSPPNPLIKISDDTNTTYNNQVGIVVGLTSSSATKTVCVNTSGLISVQDGTGCQ